MKVAIISDIHANVMALKAVLIDIEEQQVDRVYCVGDLVGYSPFPNEVIDLIREKYLMIMRQRQWQLLLIIHKLTMLIF